MWNQLSAGAISINADSLAVISDCIVSLQPSSPSSWSGAVVSTNDSSLIMKRTTFLVELAPELNYPLVDAYQSQVILIDCVVPTGVATAVHALLSSVFAAGCDFSMADCSYPSGIRLHPPHLLSCCGSSCIAQFFISLSNCSLIHSVSIPIILERHLQLFSQRRLC